MDYMLEPPCDEPILEDFIEELGEEWEEWVREQKLEYPDLSDEDFMALDAWVEQKYQDMLYAKGEDDAAAWEDYQEYCEEQCS